MNFETFKQTIDQYLGLQSTPYVDDDESNRYLEYYSPTGVLLFSLSVVKTSNGVWEINPISDPLPGMKLPQISALS